MKVFEKSSLLFRIFDEFGVVKGLEVFWKVISKSKQDITLILPGEDLPIHMRKSTSDIAVFRQLYIDKEYDIQLDIEPATIIDCGSNIGLSILVFSKMFPASKIIAIEPDKGNFQMLEKNTDHKENVERLNAGIWYKTAPLEIIDRNEFGSWALEVKEVDQRGPCTIDGTSIDDICRKRGITEIGLLKIDIEGSEKEIFENDPHDWLSITRNLIIETHDRMRPGTGKAVLDALGNYTYQLELSGDCLVFKNIYPS